MIDGFEIRYGYVSLLYTQCWLAALAMPIGVMGLVLVSSRRPSLFLINGIWSVSVACILYSAMTVYMYHHWGMEMLLFYKHLQADSFFSDSRSSSLFVKKDSLLEYTKEEEDALAVFGITIILSIIEIIVAAAIAKTGDASYHRPQPSPVYYMNYQPGGDVPQLGRANAGPPEIHGTTAHNQPAGGVNYVSL